MVRKGTKMIKKIIFVILTTLLINGIVFFGLSTLGWWFICLAWGLPFNWFMVLGLTVLAMFFTFAHDPVKITVDTKQER